MKNLILLTLLYFCPLFWSGTGGEAIAQNAKGFSVAKQEQQKTKGKTYALIVGISKYKNPAIPQLQFADRDAIAFNNYLISNGVDSSEIILLLNENAKYGDVLFDLDDICTNKAKTGDKFYFYFSGHGDVESRVITNDGYLLPYDAPKAVYAISAINVNILQAYLSTLSAKGVQVIFIADACHSGKLAGGLEGIKNIAAVLKENWKDEVKILSCQPGEISLEGKQWGNGRGLFSYELINGLAGLADKNKNGKVSLNELNIYLSEKVPEEALISQYPLVSGNMNLDMAMVNPAYLESLAPSQTNQTIAEVDTKGTEETLLKNLPDNIKKHYYDFKAAMDSQYYFNEGGHWVTVYDNLDGWTHGGESTLVNLSLIDGDSLAIYTKAAYDYYKMIPVNDSTKILLSLMRRNLAAKMMFEVDWTVVGLIEHPSFRIEEMYETSFANFYLQPMLEMFGKEKLISMGILPKLLYLDALKKGVYRLPNENNLSTLDSAIALDGNAAYAIQLRAIASKKMGDVNLAIKYAKQANSISPNFIYPYLTLGDWYRNIGIMDSAIYYYKLGESLEKQYPFIWKHKLGVCYYVNGQLYNIDSLERQHYPNMSVADYYFEVKDYKKAVDIYLKILDTKDSSKFGQMLTTFQYERIMHCYLLLNDNKNAFIYLEKVMSIKNDFYDYESFENNHELDSIRNTSEFKKLMKKYFPDQYNQK